MLDEDEDDFELINDDEVPGEPVIEKPKPSPKPVVEIKKPAPTPAPKPVEDSEEDSSIEVIRKVYPGTKDGKCAAFQRKERKRGRVPADALCECGRPFSDHTKGLIKPNQPKTETKSTTITREERIAIVKAAPKTPHKFLAAGLGKPAKDAKCIGCGAEWQDAVHLK